MVELNRPNKLNSLNGSMIRKITPRLREWEKSQLANVIIMSGAGTKAFCAGGDVVEIATQNDTPGGREASSGYFKLEYQLDHLIATYSKPYVAVMDGITMGGGVGLSVHAPFRIATEKTVFAMPETTIGFFPDVGGSFFLPRLDGEIGTHLALTSERLYGVQTLYAGIATHYVDSSVLASLTTRLSELQFRDYASLADRLRIINSTIAEFTSGLPPSRDVPPEAQYGNLSSNLREAIDRCYAFQTVEEIVQALEAESQSTESGAMPEWAESTLSSIMSRSPTSLKVTLRQLRLGSRWNIEEAFQHEYQMARKFMSHPDFVEGVTARLTKPRRDPKWNPARLEDVRDEDVDVFFDGSISSPSAADSNENDNDNYLHLFPTSPYSPDQKLNIRYHQYPHAHFALPSEDYIRHVVEKGKNEGQGWKRAELINEIVNRYGGKFGVRGKVQEVLARRTKSSEETNGRIVWV